MSKAGRGGAVVQYAGVPVMVEDGEDVDVVAAVLVLLGLNVGDEEGAAVAVGWAREMAGSRAKTMASERRLNRFVLEDIFKNWILWLGMSREKRDSAMQCKETSHVLDCKVQYN